MLRAQAAPRKKTGPVEMVCWRGRKKCHRRDDCTAKVWCSFCKRKGHTDKAGTKKERERSAHWGAAGGEDCAFGEQAEGAGLSGQRLQIQRKGVIVDTSATSHIINGRSKFKNFDSTFKSERHSMELADGKRTVGVVQGRGYSQVCLINSEGR